MLYQPDWEPPGPMCVLIWDEGVDRLQFEHTIVTAKVAKLPFTDATIVPDHSNGLAY